MKEAIRLYVGVGEKDYNHHPVYTGPYACVSPVYGSREESKRVNAVSVPKDARVIQDSGAFSDGPAQRLSFEEALERQMQHAERYGYADQIEARASYDCLLIDEIWENGIRRKERWPEEAGEFAVKMSVEAARYMKQHYQAPAILSAQGVSPDQYLKCAEQIVPHLGPADIFGLGGWCIIGKMPKRMMPIFRQSMHKVIPFLGREGVRRVHIWGVCYAPALGTLLSLCDEADIALSTDSVGPSTRPAATGSWGYASWTDKAYKRPPILNSCKTLDANGNKAPTCPPDTVCRGLERARHVQATREWLSDFRTREAKHYRPPVQKSLFDWLEDAS